MSSTWKTVRVFISSTFRDMHAERDHLIKVTFPTLREKLLPYRVIFASATICPRWSKKNTSLPIRSALIPR